MSTAERELQVLCDRWGKLKYRFDNDQAFGSDELIDHMDCAVEAARRNAASAEGEAGAHRCTSACADSGCEVHAAKERWFDEGFAEPPEPATATPMMCELHDYALPCPFCTIIAPEAAGTDQGDEHAIVKCPKCGVTYGSLDRQTRTLTCWHCKAEWQHPDQGDEEVAMAIGGNCWPKGTVMNPTPAPSAAAAPSAEATAEAERVLTSEQGTYCRVCGEQMEYSQHFEKCSTLQRIAASLDSFAERARREAIEEAAMAMVSKVDRATIRALAASRGKGTT